MGILNNLLGNAGEISIEETQQEVQHVLIDGETIEKGFKTFRDLVVFTSKRLILIDKQGMTGKKVEYLSIPYAKISSYALETAGTFDMDAELKLWVSGRGLIQKTFKKGSGIVELSKILSNHIL